ncbi:unnamed protein product [Polarella glacialis]|uniref:Uncharacterized protein n=1 Tax=Polarella glacialis TaxID=89957 RepID=A0A813E7M3_POLGL|nr:unnamed protein product [Polarella glacialis]
MDPALRKPFKTDLATLFCSDANGGCLECKEVGRAVCMSTEPRKVWAAKKNGQQATVLEGSTYVDVYMQTLDGEVVSTEGRRLASLRVPPQFAMLEYNWAAPSSQQSKPSLVQQERMRSCLKIFVGDLLQGITLQLRLDKDEVDGTPDGRDITAGAKLSPDLSTLQLSVRGVDCNLPMASVRWVRPPADESSGLLWFLPNDRHTMVVLRLAGGRFVRFRFQQKDQAAYFGTCMRFLLKACISESR